MHKDFKKLRKSNAAKKTRMFVEMDLKAAFGATNVHLALVNSFVGNMRDALASSIGMVRPWRAKLAVEYVVKATNTLEGYDLDLSPNEPCSISIVVDAGINFVKTGLLDSHILDHGHTVSDVDITKLYITAWYFV